MKINVSENGSIVLSDVFNAVIIATDEGEFGVAQRDGGIEVMHKGIMVYSSQKQTEQQFNQEVLMEQIESMADEAS